MACRSYSISLSLVDSGGNTLSSGATVWAAASFNSIQCAINSTTFFKTTTTATDLKFTATVSSEYLFKKWTIQYKWAANSSWTTVTKYTNPASQAILTSIQSNIPVNVTLTLDKNIITKTVTLDPNGGTVDVSEIECTVGEKYGELPTPTRDGYSFLGWFDAKEDGNQITEDTDFTESSPTTLYANWKKDDEPGPGPEPPSPSQKTGYLAYGSKSDSLAYHRTSGSLIYN